MADLRQAAMATTAADRRVEMTRRILIAATCCVLAVITLIYALSWAFAAPPMPPRTCGAGGIYRALVDPKPDGVPYLTIVCRSGETWAPSIPGN